jgi:hypothetical protein
MDFGPGAERGIGRTIDVRARHRQWWGGGSSLQNPRHHPILELLPGEHNQEKYIRLFSSIHVIYIAIDIVYVYAVLYRSIYHLKYKGSYGGSNTEYAGHLGMPIPKSRVLLKFHFFGKHNRTKRGGDFISFYGP